MAPRDNSLIGEEGIAEHMLPSDHDLYKKSPEIKKTANRVEVEELFKHEELGATDAS